MSIPPNQLVDPSFPPSRSGILIIVSWHIHFKVSSAFSFLYTRDKLLLVQQENALLTCCKEFQKKFGDIDSDEMSAELQRFVLILQKKRNPISCKVYNFLKQKAN